MCLKRQLSFASNLTEVQDRLASSKHNYQDNVPDSELKRLAIRTANMLEMLTGYSTEIITRAHYKNTGMLADDLHAIDTNPTIVLDRGEGLRPIIRNGTDRYRLLDSRVGGSLLQDRTVNKSEPYGGNPQAFDRLWTIEELFLEMRFIIRLGNRQSLILADAIRNVDSARSAFESYYYAKCGV